MQASVDLPMCLSSLRNLFKCFIHFYLGCLSFYWIGRVLSIFSKFVRDTMWGVLSLFSALPFQFNWCFSKNKDLKFWVNLVYQLFLLFPAFCVLRNLWLKVYSKFLYGLTLNSDLNNHMAINLGVQCEIRAKVHRFLYRYQIVAMFIGRLPVSHWEALAC